MSLFSDVQTKGVIDLLSGNSVTNAAFASGLTVAGKTVIKDGDPVAVASGEFHLMSGNVYVMSGFVSVASSGVAISHYSGALNVNISGGVLPVVSGGVVPVGIIESGSTKYNTYSLFLDISGISHSGDAASNLIGIYNPGAVSQVEIIEVSQRLSFTGEYNLILIRTSGGQLSGLSSTPIPYNSANVASTVSGYILSGTHPNSGIITASGFVVLDLNRVNLTQYGQLQFTQKPIARSGESLLIRVWGSGTGFGVLDLSMTWVEHN